MAKACRYFARSHVHSSRGCFCRCHADFDEAAGFPDMPLLQSPDTFNTILSRFFKLSRIDQERPSFLEIGRQAATLVRRRIARSFRRTAADFVPAGNRPIPARRVWTCTWGFLGSGLQPVFPKSSLEVG